MQPDKLALWADVRRLLLVQIGNVPAVLLAAPAVRALSDALPGAEITLLTAQSSAQAATVLPGVSHIIATQAIWLWHPGQAAVMPEDTRSLVEALRARRFDASIILPDGNRSPYPAAYVCYLAGIPIRLGQSHEFGGGLLSPGIKPPAPAGRETDPGLALLAAAGLIPGRPTSPRSASAGELFGEMPVISMLGPAPREVGPAPRGVGPAPRGGGPAPRETAV